ncbi:MAG: efflux transporter outer membrane subunit [Prosthecobacter sp.]|jgi:multidrug efflux pump|uniref:efflux RND transporter permease subunit n=1 Tax=Prosthecobacter sp. TaxID=1965333 RepID=UPI0019DAA7DF|nr:efflux RND transporter permease subunit [Prosthecobacter sp.]MBE2287588.1 efflux transporter outer membrane subunit [Prosthecobacter sp.]
MWLSDTSVRRPVLAMVMNLILIAFGIVAYTRLAVREYPDIEPPIVTVETYYRGASANVVERRITQRLEDRISQVEAIKNISSVSTDGKSEITVEFNLGRDLDAAANDIREAISPILPTMPEEVEPPNVGKTELSSEVLMYLNLTSEFRSTLELNDYAERYLVDRFSRLPGIARVRINGGSRYALRVWLDREALAARGLTALDVEEALRRENVDPPAGAVQSLDRQFTVRLNRQYQSTGDFEKLVIARGENGYQVRLAEVAKVELGAEEARNVFKGNRVLMVSLGMIRQSRANPLEVARAVRAEAEKIRETLPKDMRLENSYDISQFIEESIHEVYRTLIIALVLVVAIIYLFLGSMRAVLVPVLAVPVSMFATCIVLMALDYSMNTLTLLAFVLAIGLVVDDAIVVLENIHRRIEEGEKPLVAAYLGTRQVGFAVVATTLVLMSVFVPVTFMPGDTGRLFAEFSVTLAIAVGFSGFVALTLSPMLASKILRGREGDGLVARLLEKAFGHVQAGYRRVLGLALRFPATALPLVAGITVMCWWLLKTIPDEFTPREDRGSFFVTATSPPGTTFANTLETMNAVNERLMYLVEGERNEATRVNARAPRTFGSAADFHESICVVTLTPFGTRRDGFQIMDELRAKTGDIPQAKISITMRQGMMRGLNKALEIVVSGPTFEELAAWRDIILRKAKENPNLVGFDCDYRDTKPQLRVSINQTRAADLGVSSANIGRTLETLLGGRRATTFIHQGEEYDVILEGSYRDKRSPLDLNNIFVRSERSQELIPLANLVTMDEFADSGTLNRYNRMRSITFDAELVTGYSLGQAVQDMEQLIHDNLPASAVIGYKGNSLKLKESSGSSGFIFALALLVAFLVLAAQFESFVHPLTIMLTVPVAVAGALLGLQFMGMNQSIYSQIGLIMLIGLAAKNGILIVEFINQLRDEGLSFHDAILRASEQRLRPIVMTALATVMGALPLMLGHGAGFETRMVVGVVIVFGVSLATLVTLFLVPMVYGLIAQRTGSPLDVTRRLESELSGEEAKERTNLPALVHVLLLALLLLPSCNLAPNYLIPQPKLPTEFKTEGPWRTATPKDDASRGNWWSLFRDSKLNTLMKQAEAGSPTLELAAHRVTEAQALARADRAGLFPFLTFNGSALRNRGSSNMKFQFAGGRTRNTLGGTLDFDYELDFWGKLRNQARSGVAKAEAEHADYHTALLGLQSELALNYFTLRAQDAQIALLKRTVGVRRKTVDLARTRFEQGDIAQIDVAQAETELASAEAEAIGLEKKRAELEHAIALLLGLTPSQFSLTTDEIRGSPPSIPASVPSDLLERRPDIAAAERQMASLNAEIGVAKAALFPSVRIGLTGGTQTSYVWKLLDAQSRVWGLGPGTIEWPLLRGGGVRANIDATKARYDQAAASYKNTVLSAVRDVEDALSGLSVLQRQAAAQAATADSARRALELSQKRYDSGLVAYYEVLDAQRTLLRAEQEATRIQGERFLSAILLIKALGGGW